MPTKTTKSPTKAKTPKKEPAPAPQEALEETYNADGEISDAPAAEAKKATPESQAESPADRLKGLEDKFIRLRAEYDNFMKRTAREKYQLAAFGGESVVRAVLPVLDDLQRLIDHAREAKSGSDEALLTGAEMWGRESRPEFSRFAIICRIVAELKGTRDTVLTLPEATG